MLNHILTKFNNVDHLNQQFLAGLPDPMISLDNFLPVIDAEKMFVESQCIPDQYWKEFTRNGSYMREFTDLENMPEGLKLVSTLHSSMFLKWLEDITGIDGLIPDPHIVGGGYSKSYNGDSLKIHSDFNWNDKLRLHRALSFIVYLTPKWDPAWGGSLEFYDRNQNDLISSVDCCFNRAVIWKYNNRGFHGFPKPLTCPSNLNRTTFRIFYYTSNAEYNPTDRPHRSLYWYNKDLNEPYDIPTHK